MVINVRRLFYFMPIYFVTKQACICEQIYYNNILYVKGIIIIYQNNYIHQNYKAANKIMCLHCFMYVCRVK